MRKLLKPYTKVLKAISEAIILVIKGLYLILGCMIIIPIALFIVLIQYVYESVMVKPKQR